jgi:hypothetical protein
MNKRSKIETFNSQDLANELANIRVTENPVNGIINTYIGSERTASYKPKSKNYQVVDFATVGEAFADQVGKHLSIKKSKLDLYGGVQELRLYGDDITINGDTYANMACLMSSTDGTRTLRVAFGLIRWICSNGQISQQFGEHFKARHLKSNEAVIKTLDFDFGNIAQTFDHISNTIEPLAKKNVSLQEIKKSITEGPNGKVVNAKKFLSFAQKLLSSKTDRLTNKEATAQQIKALQSGEALFTTNKKFDMDLNAYKAFQCYTEIFRSQDMGELQKETDRILSVVA